MLGDLLDHMSSCQTELNHKVPRQIQDIDRNQHQTPVRLDTQPRQLAMANSIRVD